jgi:aminopeptidase YwaD
MNEQLYKKSLNYLDVLCNRIAGRGVGSEGNREATRFFEQELRQLGWRTSKAEFDAMDWRDIWANLMCNGDSYEVFAGPYSLPFSGTRQLVAISDTAGLEKAELEEKIVLLYGEIAREQLMPKNFVFYNPDEHRQIIALLEKGKPAAIISATGRNSALAGGVYPFPLIEDGDFDIPSVYMTEEEGERLLKHAGGMVTLESRSERIPGKGYNVIGMKGGKQEMRQTKDDSSSGDDFGRLRTRVSESNPVDPGNNASAEASLKPDRIVVTAHIDAKKGTPGAIDNATGVIVLLLLADLLRDYEGKRKIELVAFNGEDYYAVPGQMNYIMANQENFGEMILNINIDGAGYLEGISAFSPFNLPEEIYSKTSGVIARYPGITEGAQWPQGDHSIFVQYGVPALAVTSKWFIDNMESQDITHTPKDNPGITDCRKLVEIALALNDLVRLI